MKDKIPLSLLIMGMGKRIEQTINATTIRYYNKDMSISKGCIELCRLYDNKKLYKILHI